MNKMFLSSYTIVNAQVKGSGEGERWREERKPRRLKGEKVASNRFVWILASLVARMQSGILGRGILDSALLHPGYTQHDRFVQEQPKHGGGEECQTKEDSARNSSAGVYSFEELRTGSERSRRSLGMTDQQNHCEGLFAPAFTVFSLAFP
jgi:hypothetical protein